MKRLRNVIPNCRDTAALLSRAQDVPLSLRERFRVQSHLLFCRYCRRYARQIILLRQVLQRIRGQKTTAALDLAVRHRIQEAFESERGHYPG